MRNVRNMIFLSIFMMFLISAGVVEPKSSVSQIESNSVEFAITDVARGEVYVNVIKSNLVALDSVIITMKDGRVIEGNSPIYIGSYLEGSVLEMTISKPGYQSLEASFTVIPTAEPYSFILHK